MNPVNENIQRRSGRKTKAVKNDVRVISYFDRNYVEQYINRYGTEIGSVTLSNTVRSIVLRFLKNHSPRNRIVNNPEKHPNRR